MKRFVFLVLVTLENKLNLDQRFMDRGSDRWANFLADANEKLWPEYDGEGWKDWILG